MKQKDIALVVIIVIISAFLSIFISKNLISSPKNRQAKVEVVEKISSDFQQPSTNYFNSSAVDPTKLIQIGDNSNPKPFQ